MSAAEAFSALGTPVSAAREGCEYITPPGAPEGIRFMVAGATVARVDVTAGDTPTAEGARIGQAEDDVATLYTGRVAVSPHKYEEGGHYLTVLPKEGQNPRLRLIFETNGKTVTRYHAGRLPEVEWVEGCG